MSRRSAPPGSDVAAIHWLPIEAEATGGRSACGYYAPRELRLRHLLARVAEDLGGCTCILPAD